MGNPAAGLQTVYRRSWAMGSDVTFTVLHAKREVADEAIAAALLELRRIEGVMSIYQPDSQVSQLNRDGRVDEPHPLLVATLNRAADISQRTGGAFDVTVQPLWTLYASADKAGQPPSDGQIESARRLVRWQDVDVTPSRVRLGRPGMGVTLNGIAMGLATDRVLAVLASHGIENALVNIDQVAPLGRKENGQPWTVGVQHPRRPDAYVATAALDGRCMSTSGDYETRFFNSYDTNHIFDPATGRSPLELASVTVVTGQCLDADALSTAVFVLGPEKGMKFLAAIPRTDCLLVLKDGRMMVSEGFPKA